MDYLNNKHADIEPEPSPKTYYCEYANLRNTPGRCVEPETETQTLALIDEVADAPPRPNVTSWFHIEGVNDTVLREFFARMKLNTGAPSNGGHAEGAVRTATTRWRCSSSGTGNHGFGSSGRTCTSPCSS